MTRLEKAKTAYLAAQHAYFAREAEIFDEDFDEWFFSKEQRKLERAMAVAMERVVKSVMAANERRLRSITKSLKAQLTRESERLARDLECVLKQEVSILDSSLQLYNKKHPYSVRVLVDGPIESREFVLGDEYAL